MIVIQKLSLAALLACAIGMAGMPAVTFAGDTAALKATLAKQPKAKAFADSLDAFDKEANAAGGKAPKDGAARLRGIESNGAGAKGELRALAAHLAQNQEIDAYNDLALRTAREWGLKSIAADLTAAGGAYAVLRKADSYIDEEVGDRRKLAGTPVARLLEQGRDLTLLDFVGIDDAEAGLRSWGCSVFHYVISFGYASDSNYVNCMQQ
jgi:hypothetical protein